MKAEFKDRLREAMIKRRVRAVDMANALDIPKSAVSYYMNGKLQPKDIRLHEIAKYLKVSQAWLLGYNVPMERGDEQISNDVLEEALRMIETNPNFRDIVIMLYQILYRSPEEYELVDKMVRLYSKHIKDE